MRIERKRYVVMRKNRTEVWCGLAKHFSFRPIMVLPAKPDQTIYQWRIGDDCPSVSRLDGVQINADGEITYPIWNGYLIPEDFGKTVFLTRGEAEAALRREQDG